MRKNFWSIGSPKKKIQKIISKVVEKVEKPAKPHPLLQGREHGWPSAGGLKRRFRKNFIKDWR
jgi:hypothetical protein